jgi:hypothetical protein
VNDLVKEAEESQDQQKINLALEIKSLMQFGVSDTEISIQKPTNNTFQEANKTTIDEFQEFLTINIPTDGAELDADGIKLVFEIALQKMAAVGWNVVIDRSSSRSGIHVVQESREVVIPEGRKLSAEKLKSLVIHELGTHVTRRLNGERSKLTLLGLGFDRYKDDEGIATMREQVLKEEFDEFSGFEAHLAIGLAYGIDGRKPRNFRETYEILYRIFKLQALLKGKTIEEAEKRAIDRAWNRCIRTFRGTACSIPGICFTKDIFYRESNIDIWRIWTDNPARASTFNLGKFDPANPRHRMLLIQLDILPKELDDLERTE